MDAATFAYGFGVSFSLIMAIGAQNAFVLKHGLKKRHVLLVCLICALSDALLISAGVFGLGALITRHEALSEAARYLGALFLLCYGAASIKAAFSVEAGLEAGGRDAQGALQAAALTLAFTWLNPHVYLDTLVLVGSVSARFPDKAAFACGAVSASFLWFFGLGYGARLLQPLFAKPKAWQVLDILIGLLMWVLAAVLLTGPAGQAA